MSRFLRDKDYLGTITQADLDEILEGNNQYRIDKEQVAQAEIRSYTIQRYDMDSVFGDTVDWSPLVVYKAKNLIYMTAADYSASAAYSVNDLINFTDGYIWICVISTSAGQSPLTHPTKWVKIALKDSLFYVKLPNNEYDYSVTYAKDDIVWFKNHRYQAKTPLSNILPTDSNYWTDLGAYTVAAGIYPTNTTLWTAGDNRPPLIVEHYIGITLFHLYKRINPRFIPDLRKEAYDGNNALQTGGAIGWLKRISKGEINADLPKIAPAQGNTVRFGNSDGTITRSSNQY